MNDHARIDDPAPGGGGMLLILSAAVGVAMVGMGIIWPLMPVYAQTLGARGIELGLIIASFNIARTLAGPLAGRLSDRWSRKPFLGTGLLLYALVSMLYLQAATIGSLVAVRLLHGMAAVLVLPVAMALAADMAPPRELGRYMGTLSMAVMLGLGLGPVMGGVIREHFGMDAAFACMGALALLTFIGVAALLPRRPTAPGGGSRSRPLPGLLANPTVRVLVILRVFTAAGQGCVYTFLPLLAMDLHVTSSQVGLLLGANIFLMAFLQRLCGSLADRTSPVPLMLGGTLLSALAVAAMPFAGDFVTLLAINMVMGAGSGAATAAGFVVAGRLGRTLGQGAVMGVTDSGWSLGLIAAPILAGLVMDLLGTAAVFLVGGVIIAAGTALSGVLVARARTGGHWVDTPGSGMSS